VLIFAADVSGSQFTVPGALTGDVSVSQPVAPVTETTKTTETTETTETTDSDSSSFFDLSSIFDFFTEIVDEIVDWLFNVISKFGTYLLDIVLFIPRYFYVVLADLVVYFLDFAYSFLPNFSGISELISSINSSSIGFFLDLFQFTFGLKVVLGAYFCRFFIRRLPGIG
jgi:hypothetical protein